MTVGIAAIAENGKKLVLCADRRLTEDGASDQSLRPKIREVGYGWRFLYEGLPDLADTLQYEILRQIRTKAVPQMDARDILAEVQADMVDLQGRTPQDEDGYFGLGLTLVGFDLLDRAAGFTLREDKNHTIYSQDIRDSGYLAIGSGGEIAATTLNHYAEFAPSRGTVHPEPLAQVLYKVWEAKRRSDERRTDVGKSPTDLWIATGGQQHISYVIEDFPIGLTPVPNEIIEVLDELFISTSSPPWDRKPQPPDWEQVLNDYTQKLGAGWTV